MPLEVAQNAGYLQWGLQLRSENFEAIYPSKMAPTSLSNDYCMFLNLHMLWMCTWMNTYHITASLVGQVFGA